MMNNNDIQRYIRELDAAVPKEGAKLLIAQCDEQGIYCRFSANRLGYLRAGIEMLRAAVEPLAPGEYNTRVDMNYLVGERGALVRELIRRDDVEATFQSVKKKRTWKQTVAEIGCVGLFICLAVCIVIGVIQIALWISGH